MTTSKGFPNDSKLVMIRSRVVDMKDSLLKAGTTTLINSTSENLSTSNPLLPIITGLRSKIGASKV
jgi:hypothetical protein